jgi:hypothetical protein
MARKNNVRDLPQFEIMLSNQTDDEFISDRTSELTIFTNESTVRVESGSIKFSQR